MGINIAFSYKIKDTIRELKIRPKVRNQKYNFTYFFPNAILLELVCLAWAIKLFLLRALAFSKAAYQDSYLRYELVGTIQLVYLLGDCMI